MYGRGGRLVGLAALSRMPRYVHTAPGLKSKFQMEEPLEDLQAGIKATIPKEFHKSLGDLFEKTKDKMKKNTDQFETDLFTEISLWVEEANKKDKEDELRAKAELQKAVDDLSKKLGQSSLMSTTQKELLDIMFTIVDPDLSAESLTALRESLEGRIGRLKNLDLEDKNSKTLVDDLCKDALDSIDDAIANKQKIESLSKEINTLSKSLQANTKLAAERLPKEITDEMQYLLAKATYQIPGDMVAPREMKAFIEKAEKDTLEKLTRIRKADGHEVTKEQKNIIQQHFKLSQELSRAQLQTDMTYISNKALLSRWYQNYEHFHKHSGFSRELTAFIGGMGSLLVTALGNYLYERHKNKMMIPVEQSVLLATVRYEGIPGDPRFPGAPDHLSKAQKKLEDEVTKGKVSAATLRHMANAVDHTIRALDDLLDEAETHAKEGTKVRVPVELGQDERNLSALIKLKHKEFLDHAKSKLRYISTLIPKEDKDPQSDFNKARSELRENIAKLESRYGKSSGREQRHEEAAKGFTTFGILTQHTDKLRDRVGQAMGTKKPAPGETPPETPPSGPKT